MIVTKQIKNFVGNHMLHLGWSLWGQDCDCGYGLCYRPLTKFTQWRTRHETDEMVDERWDRMPLSLRFENWLVDTGTNMTTEA